MTQPSCANLSIRKTWQMNAEQYGAYYPKFSYISEDVRIRVEMKSCEVYKYQQDNSCSIPANTCRVSCVELLMFINGFASIIVFKLTSLCGRIFSAIQFSSFDSLVEFGMMRALPSEVKNL